MNLKKLALKALARARPIYIKSIRVYRKRYRGTLIVPPEYAVQFSPRVPKGAVKWAIEGDEVVITCHHPCVYLGYIRLVQDSPGIRTSIRSIIRRYRAKSGRRRLRS